MQGSTAHEPTAHEPTAQQPALNPDRTPQQKMLAALNVMKYGHIYAGTANAHQVATRRAKNKVARQSRRVNRGR